MKESCFKSKNDKGAVLRDTLEKSRNRMKASVRLLLSIRAILQTAGVVFVLMTVVGAAVASDALGNEAIEKIMTERKKLERDLAGLQKQLEEYQAKMKKTVKDEASSLKDLKNYTRQLKLLEEMISKNQAKIRMQDTEIQILKDRFAENQDTYSTLVEDFRRIAVVVYKNGSTKQDIELLYASGSLNEAIVRTRYIGFFADAVFRTVDDLQHAAQELQESRMALEESSRKRAGIVQEQESKARDFSKKKKEKQVVLNTLKKNKKKFAGAIQANQKKLQQLQAKIEELIAIEQKAIEEEQERRRLAAERSGKPEEYKPFGDLSAAELAKISGDFDKALGLLPWPVDNGIVVRKFGKVKDPDLHIITTNNGIDISVPSGTPVRAVFGGKIAQIAYLPTYGNIVIIRHMKSYLTVYANLVKINVAKNDIVSRREIIGFPGTMPEGGSLLHFELWKGKVKQDPQKWLKK